MKHPREVLFERHRSTEPKLDAIRQKALATLPMARVGKSHQEKGAPGVRSLLRELLLPFRWHLAGMSAVWVLAALLNMDSSHTEARNMTKQDSSPPRQLLTALRENRRQIAELIESPANVREPSPAPPPFVPKRRGEIQSTNAMA